jgi:hypothetical protein
MAVASGACSSVAYSDGDGGVVDVDGNAGGSDVIELFFSVSGAASRASVSAAQAAAGGGFKGR